MVLWFAPMIGAAISAFFFVDSVSMVSTGKDIIEYTTGYDIIDKLLGISESGAGSGGTQDIVLSSANDIVFIAIAIVSMATLIYFIRGSKKKTKGKRRSL